MCGNPGGGGGAVGTGSVASVGAAVVLVASVVIKGVVTVTFMPAALSVMLKISVSLRANKKGKEAPVSGEPCTASMSSGRNAVLFANGSELFFSGAELLLLMKGPETGETLLAPSSF